MIVSKRVLLQAQEADWAWLNYHITCIPATTMTLGKHTSFIHEGTIEEPKYKLLLHAVESCSIPWWVNNSHSYTCLFKDIFQDYFTFSRIACICSYIYISETWGVLSWFLVTNKTSSDKINKSINQGFVDSYNGPRKTGVSSCLSGLRLMFSVSSLQGILGKSKCDCQ